MTTDPIPEIDGFTFRQKLLQSERCTLWRAEQTVLERDVLVGVFSPEVIQDKFLLSAHFSVMRTLAQTKCRLVPDVIDLIRTEHQAYVVLEDRHARSVLNLLDGHRLEAGQLLRIATDMAEGFAELHAAHLVYTALCPQSLYVSEVSEPLLPDISLVRFEAGHGESPELKAVGAELAPYLAPEVYETPEAVDTRADMFALGMTLYALATGQVPFGAFSEEEIVRRKQRSVIPSPCDVSPNFPPELAVVLAKLTNRTPAGRYAGWDDVAFDLHQAGRGITPEGDAYADSVIAPPNPMTRAHAGRTVRLSVEDLRNYRRRQAEKTPIVWLRVILILFVFVAILVAIGGFVWRFVR